MAFTKISFIILLQWVILIMKVVVDYWRYEQHSYLVLAYLILVNLLLSYFITNHRNTRMRFIYLEKRASSSYYNWRDHIGCFYSTPSTLDYDKKCHILLQELHSPQSKYILINLGRVGGLGHKLIDIILSINYALLLNRKYYSKKKTPFFCSKHERHLLE